MILDRLENIARYRGLSRRMAQAIDLLLAEDWAAREDGRYELDGEAIVAIVQQYTTKPADQGIWEAHRRYIDIQVMFRGTELMGWAPLPTLKITEPYNRERDVMFLEGSGSTLRVAEGIFSIVHPEDGPKPTLADGAPAVVRKVVFKVQVEQP